MLPLYDAGANDTGDNGGRVASKVKLTGQSGSVKASPVLPATVASVRVPKAAELVADTIRRQIIRGELADGSSLPAEARLIERFQISRPTIREAIRILESEGLVSVSRGARGGAKVSAPSFDLVSRAAGIALQSKGATVGDLYAARTIIEPPAARMVAMNGGAHAVRVLRAQLEKEVSLAHDREACVLAIADFHRIMMELCGNVTLMMIGHALQGLVEQHLAIAGGLNSMHEDAAGLEKRTRFGLRSHARLIDLVEQGDGEGAERHWRNHMNAAGVYWLEFVAPTSLVDLLA